MLWGSRVVIPSKGRSRALTMLHETHPGIVPMKSVARDICGGLGWIKRSKRVLESVQFVSPLGNSSQLHHYIPGLGRTSPGREST